MSSQQSNQDPSKPKPEETAATSKRSWLKSKTAKVFSSSKPSRSSLASSATVAAGTSDSKTSRDDALSKFPLRTGQPLPSGLRPISELWDEAYEELREKDNGLIAEYEALVSKSLVGAVALSGLGRVQRHQLMRVLLGQKIKEVEDGTWKVQFKDHEFLIKDLVEPVIGVVEWAKDYVGSALEPSPPASIAWAGVCLLLPIVLNSSKQEAARVKGLGDIATIISQCAMRETLYHRRYEVSCNDESTKSFSTSHISYRDALRALYVKILSFQAISVCFLSENTFQRLASDTAKWNDWDKMLIEIKDLEITLKSTEEQWRDMKYDEECELHRARHEERMKRLSVVEEEIARVRKAIVDAQKNRERQGLLKWLASSIDPSTNYNSARRDHALSTSQWLVEQSEDFKTWCNDQTSFLWLHGSAGAGKSFLSSSVIHHLETLYCADPYTAVAYFFFSFSDSEKQNTENMLRSLIVQLCGRRPDTPKPLLDLHRFRDINHQPDLESLEAALGACAQDFNNVYLVVDALDECPFANDEREMLLNVLGRIVGSALSNLHVFCTSRPEPDIKAKLAPLFSRPRTKIIDLLKRREEVDQDIITYIDQKIEQSSKFRSWPLKIKEEVKVTLTEKADGMFQYVSLQLKALETAKSLEAVRQSLQDLPAGLDQTYTRALLSIHPSQQAQAICALKWLAFSERPITIEELAEASMIDPQMCPPFEEGRRLFKPSAVLDNLPGLVVAYHGYDDNSDVDSDDDPVHDDSFVGETRVGLGSEDKSSAEKASQMSVEKSDGDLAREPWLDDNEDIDGPTSSGTPIRDQEVSDTDNSSGSSFDFSVVRFVRLAHFSIKEFLVSSRIKDGPASSFSIDGNDVCIQLAESCLAYHLYVSDAESQFLWTQPKSPLPWSIKTLYKNWPLCEYATEYWTKHTEAVSQDAWPQSLLSLIELSIKPGTESLLLMLESWDYLDNIWNAEDKTVTSSVYYLVVHGHLNLLNWVLEHELGDVNAIGGEFGTVLNFACYYDQEYFVQLLLEKGANPFLGNQRYCCALQPAIEGGGGETAALLLNRDNSLAKFKTAEFSPLHWATESNLLATVELLLRSGAEVDAEHHGRTPIILAATHGRMDVIKLLLENGSNIDARYQVWGNAVQAAATRGEREAMILLLEHGAKVDPPGQEWDDLLAKFDVGGEEYYVGKSEWLRELQEYYGEASRRGELKKYNL